MNILLPLTLVPVLLCPPALAADIAWQASFEKTLSRAAAEKKVVFLAVNMDGERANDRLAQKVYAERAIVELSGHTLNLVASAYEHAGTDKPCTRFKGLFCLDHRRTDAAARNQVLKTDSRGLVVAPQHVFLDPEGTVLLSVPYEISADELAWCFVTALERVGQGEGLRLPAGARMPRRVILAGVYDPAQGLGGSTVPPTRAEVAELVSNLKKGLQGPERMESLRQLVLSDDPAAVEYIGQELKSGGGVGGGPGGGLGGGGRGGGGGGGAGGAGAGGRGAGGNEKHKLILHAIGILSPPAYWELCANFLDHNEADLRSEAAVALEMLAAPEALRALNTALVKEQDPQVEKELLRALGACGAADARTRAALVKKARGEKHELLRLNAIAALGSTLPDKEVAACLEHLLQKGSEAEKTAAACAVALLRDTGWKGRLEQAREQATDGATKEALEAAIAVLDGAELRRIKAPLKRICQDRIDRDRLFGVEREQR